MIESPVASPPEKERWLISYADLLTLLLAFFVVMYSVSQVNEQKLSKLAASLDESLNRNTASPPIKSPSFADLKIPKVKIAHNPDNWVTFSLASDLFFDEGAVQLGGDAHIELSNMLKVLATTEGPVQIEVYTNVSTLGTSYDSEWAYTAARAAAIANFLGKSGLKKERLVATGYGQGDEAEVVFKLRPRDLDAETLLKLEMITGDAVVPPKENPENELEEFDLDEVDPALLLEVLNQLDAGQN